MKSRALRFTLHFLFVGIVAGAAYVVWKNESEGMAAASAARTFAERAHAASRSLLEIKSAQPGYVAAGQGEDYWITKVDALLASTRESLATLTASAQSSAARTDVAAAADALEDFAQVDRRARDYVRSGQRLLASDLVFSDGIEKMDTAAAAIERARVAESDEALTLVSAQRRVGALAAAGAAAAGFLIMLILVPVPRAARAAAPTAVVPSEPVVRPAAEPRRIAKAAPDPPVPAAAPPPPVAPPAPAARAPKPVVPDLDLPGVASLCSDLARVLDTRALPAALERAAGLLNASGLVIWVADPDGRELLPVLAHGYPNNLLARLGTIAKEAENATAAAFRTGVVQTVKADSISHGAIAAPLLSPAGPVGVMAAEVLNDGERKEATRAAAAIVAAQLATLVGPPSSRAQGKTEAV
jgi:hypothetical protein